MVCFFFSFKGAPGKDGDVGGPGVPGPAVSMFYGYGTLLPEMSWSLAVVATIIIIHPKLLLFLNLKLEHITASSSQIDRYGLHTKTYSELVYQHILK